MTIFGVAEAALLPQLRELASPTGRADYSLDRDALVDRFARAAWTGIAEPGDRAAGTVIAVLGAETALAALVEGWPIDRLVARLGESSPSSAGDAGLGAPDLVAALDRWRPRVVANAALLAVNQAVRLGLRLLVPGDVEWPSGVDDLGPHGPIALWVRGNPALLEPHRPAIALVGARAATGYGEHVTMEASAGLVDRGYTIVSGAAYGIDGMAHRAALASEGHTVAFLAGGVDRFYPSGHDALLHRIASSGVVVSELPCGSPPTKWRFLQRNRLIAAASMATVVLEAGWRSGSLNTAGHAAALGRPLGAVPGPVTSATSAGCHRLIRDYDAICVTNADEMAELAPLAHRPVAGGDGGSGDSRAGAERPSDRASGDRLSDRAGRDGDRAGADSGGGRGGGGVAGAGAGAGATKAASGRAGDDHTTVRVLDAVSARSPRSADDIARRSGLSLREVQTVLGALDLDDRVRRRDTGWVRCNP